MGPKLKKKNKQHKAFAYGMPTSIGMDGATTYGLADDLIPSLAGSDMTWSCWVKIPVPPANPGAILRALISNTNAAAATRNMLIMNQGIAAYRADGSTWGFGTYNEAAEVSETIIEDGAWHNIIQTYNTVSTDLILYVDGAVEASRAISKTMVGTDLLQIGRWHAGSYYIDAQFGNIAFFDRDVSATEAAWIASDAGANLNAMPAGGPIHFYCPGNGDDGIIPVCIDRGTGKTNITWVNSVPADVEAGL